MNWKVWLHGLGAAIIGAVSTAVSAALVKPDTFNFTHSGLIALAQISASSAALGAAAYLKQSPLPK